MPSPSLWPILRRLPHCLCAPVQPGPPGNICLLSPVEDGGGSGAASGSLHSASAPGGSTERDVSNVGDFPVSGSGSQSESDPSAPVPSQRWRLGQLPKPPEDDGASSASDRESDPRNQSCLIQSGPNWSGLVWSGPVRSGPVWSGLVWFGPVPCSALFAPSARAETYRRGLPSSKAPGPGLRVSALDSTSISPLFTSGVGRGAESGPNRSQLLAALD